jgi:hypothetical protein
MASYEEAIFTDIHQCLSVCYSICSGAINPKDSSGQIMTRGIQQHTETRNASAANFDALTETERHALAASVVGKSNEIDPRLAAALNAYYFAHLDKAEKDKGIKCRKREHVQAWAKTLTGLSLENNGLTAPIMRAFTWRAVQDGKSGLGVSPESVAGLWGYKTTTMVRMANSINEQFHQDVKLARWEVEARLLGTGLIPSHFD